MCSVLYIDYCQGARELIKLTYGLFCQYAMVFFIEFDIIPNSCSSFHASNETKGNMSPITNWRNNLSPIETKESIWRKHLSPPAANQTVGEPFSMGWTQIRWQWIPNDRRNAPLFSLATRIPDSPSGMSSIPVCHTTLLSFHKIYSKKYLLVQAFAIGDLRLERNMIPWRIRWSVALFYELAKTFQLFGVTFGPHFCQSQQAVRVSEKVFPPSFMQSGRFDKEKPFPGLRREGYIYGQSNKFHIYKFFEVSPQECRDSIRGTVWELWNVRVGFQNSFFLGFLIRRKFIYYVSTLAVRSSGL